MATGARKTPRPPSPFPPTTNCPNASITEPAACVPSWPCNRILRLEARFNDNRNSVSKSSSVGNTEKSTARRTCTAVKNTITEAVIEEASKISSTTLGTGIIMTNTLLLPVAAISMVFVMIIPVPSVVLDILLASSITASVIVFLTAVQVRRAVDFSVFPTLLLLLTLFRLSLNLASSRRILLHGQEGTHAAGSVIEAFGQFVVGGNYVVGLVLFLALIAIQFLVVSHGAVRTAEVTARFTLDALPGKQMAIDADMNAGLIDEQGARKRRQAIAREAEVYGAMGGAAKVNPRDSVATILITAINIVAGLLIGVLQQGADLATALKTYTILTVGDGLVTIIPSLLGSIAGGMGLTRASSAGALPVELGGGALRGVATTWVGCVVVVWHALIPGL